MKLTPSKASGFTLVEMMVSVGGVALVGICVFLILQTGMVLYAKNTAENIAHDQARIAINRLLHDIHRAVSIPQLGHMVTAPADMTTLPAGSWKAYGTTKAFYADSGAGPSAGFSVQIFGSATDPNGGPFQMKNDPGNPDLIMIESGTTSPYVGQHIIFPYYNIEGDVYKLTSTGANHFNVWIDGDKQTRIKVKKGVNVICYYTTRFAYVVEGNNLNFYSTAPPPVGTSWPVTVSRNVVNPTTAGAAPVPFTQATTQYLGINLSTQDDRYSNRNFKCVNTLLAGSVPIRAQLSLSQ